MFERYVDLPEGKPYDLGFPSLATSGYVWLEDTASSLGFTYLIIYPQSHIKHDNQRVTMVYGRYIYVYL